MAPISREGRAALLVEAASCLSRAAGNLCPVLMRVYQGEHDNNDHPEGG
jgi:hypothetical protein